MGYSGISIQSQGQGGSGSATSLDVPFLRKSGIETLGVQIKPTQRRKFSNNTISWQQALDDELNWALAIVQACNNPILRQIKVIIRFNDLSPTGIPNTIEMNTEDWWNSNDAQNLALDYWRQVCQKFYGQDIFMFEILSEPISIDTSGSANTPDRIILGDFYQKALNTVRSYNSNSYFLLSPGPYGRFVDYTNGQFSPFTIYDSAPRPLLMYGFHMYKEHKYTHQGINQSYRPEFYSSTSGYGLNMINDFMSISAWSLQYGYQMYLGEFNAVRYSPNALDWVRDVITYAKQFDFHWSFFAYKPNYELWDPFYDVQNPSAPVANWQVDYVGKATPLWQFLLTQF
jgi:hypothetical protein